MIYPTMTVSDMNHHHLVAHGILGTGSCDIPDSWFDLSTGHEQDATQSSTDASVSSASPPSVVSDGSIMNNKQMKKPARSLSAYNYYFKSQREEILKSTPCRAEGKPRRSHGKIGFAELARVIASRWKSISPEEREFYDRLAAEDKARYVREMEEWKKSQCSISSVVSRVSTTQTRLEASKTLHVTHGHQTNVACVDKRHSRHVPELILMTDVPSSLIGDDFFSGIDKPLPMLSKSEQSVPTPQISDLAEKLDAESLEMLVNIFR